MANEIQVDKAILICAGYRSHGDEDYVPQLKNEDGFIALTTSPGRKQGGRRTRLRYPGESCSGQVPLFRRGGDFRIKQNCTPTGDS